jgi:predicted Zn-dependent peptidase
MMETFAKEGPTDAEMETVHKQMKNKLEVDLKEPSFWVNTLSDMDYRGTKLSDVKRLLEQMTSYTKDDLMKVMKKYIRDENRIQVIATPKQKAAPAEAPKDAEKK